MMKYESFIKKLESAFPEEPVPKELSKSDGKDYADKEDVEILRDRRWTNITEQELHQLSFAIPYLLPATLSYYMPAFLKGTYSDGALKASVMMDRLIDVLSDDERLLEILNLKQAHCVEKWLEFVFSSRTYDNVEVGNALSSYQKLTCGKVDPNTD